MSRKSWTNYPVLLTLVIGLQVIPLYGQTKLCRDRLGLLPPKRFNRRGCTDCFMYLFKNSKEIQPIKGTEFLGFKNHSRAEAGLSIAPDISTDTSVNLVCSVLDQDECTRWRSCCISAAQCCKRQLSVTMATQVGYCPRTWDGYSCWDDTPAGSIVTTPCPSFVAHMITTRSAMKQCTANATWYKKGGHAWTDYTPCLDKKAFIIDVYVSLGCSLVSVLLLVPAVVIFMAYRDLLKQDRVRLHISFFVALILSNVFNILWFMLVHYNLFTTQRNTETVLYRNPVWCRMLSFMKTYTTSTCYFWMFCEGYYLHRLISNAFEPPSTLLGLYLIGWGVPAIPVSIYACMRGFLQNDSCWAKHFGGFEWLYYAPNLCCLLVNLIFLTNILRILLFQMHSHPHEPSNFRKGLKAAFMLMPLFGLQLFLTIYRPAAGAPGQKEYEYVTIVVNNSQGLFVALIFCFFNGEVLVHLQHTCPWLRCLDSHRRPRCTAAQMTQVTTADKSPNGSLQSRGWEKNSIKGSTRSLKYSPQSNESPTTGRPAPQGIETEFHEYSQSRTSSNGSLIKKANSSPNKNRAGYTALPTTVAPEKDWSF